MCVWGGGEGGRIVRQEIVVLLILKWLSFTAYDNVKDTFLVASADILWHAVHLCIIILVYSVERR